MSEQEFNKHCAELMGVNLSAHDNYYNDANQLNDVIEKYGVTVEYDETDRKWSAYIWSPSGMEYTYFENKSRNQAIRDCISAIHKDKADE